MNRFIMSPNRCTVFGDTPLLLFLLLLPVWARAEQLPGQTQPWTKELKTVSVTASPLRQVLTESYSVTVLDSTLIEEKIATSLIDVLEQVPGITKRSEYHSAIALRGLGGKRLLITQDGNRRMGNFSGGFMGQGVNIYDLAKVEVIKGPASVKYGPGAITGIINLESKSPFLQPGMHGRALTTYGTNNEERSVLLGLNWANLDHAFSFSGRYRKADDYQCGLGTTVKNSRYMDKDLRFSYSFENNHALTLTAESECHLGGPWGRPVGFNGTSQMRVYNTCDDTWHSSLTAVWKPEHFLKRLDGSVYFDKERRRQIKDSYDTGSGVLSYREDVRYRNGYGGWRGAALLTPAAGLELTLGTDGVCYRIESPTTLTDYFLNTTVNNRVTENAGVFLAGVFAEAEYQPGNSRLKFRGGLRTDVSKVNEGGVHDTLLTEGRGCWVHAYSATAGVVYTAWRNVFWSFQAARSCRMPDASEMFIMSSGTDGLIYGNPDLKPEYGLNLDAGLRGSVGACFFDLSLFSNFLHDFISLEYWTNSGKKGINYTYLNVDKARIYGAELAVGARFLQVLHPDNRIIYSGFFVLTRGDKLTDEPHWFSKGQPLRNIPPFNTNQELLFRRMLTSAKSVYVGGDVRYYAEQDRIAPSSEGGYVSPSYCLFGASAGFTYRNGSGKWDFRLKGDNLADNRYRPFESLVPAMGRNVKMLISLVF
jgi:hemoglobin/transferrin/lactoferrin receptor protein